MAFGERMPPERRELEESKRLLYLARLVCRDEDMRPLVALTLAVDEARKEWERQSSEKKS